MPDIIIPHSDPLMGPLVARSSDYEASRIVKASSGVLYGLSGYNSGAAGFLQLFDSATLPANGTAPMLLIAIPAAGNFAIDFGLWGLTFRAGLVVCNSSTGPTKTIGAAELYLNARYK